jgi:galactitol-specific phosphotransferase system IIB component
MWRWNIMREKIAIEKNLTPIKKFLTHKGYSVESIDFNTEYTNRMEKYDAIVVTGMNDDFMGIRDINTRAVVIDASGMTPEQIYHELKLRFE